MLLRLLITVLLPVWFSPADDPGLMEHRPGVRRGMTRDQVEKTLGITEPVFAWYHGEFPSCTASYPGGITVSYDSGSRVERVEFSK